MFKATRLFAVFLFVSLFAFGLMSSALDAMPPKQKPTFTVAWSIYVGWMPWPYADQAGILKKWADQYNVIIDLKQMDYGPSVDAFTAGKVDACLMTNMEMVDSPGSSGRKCRAIIVGDYSNGNDALLARDGLEVKDLPGNNVYLVTNTVSHYLLARCLEMNGGLAEADLTLKNTSDADIRPGFETDSSQKFVVTWNPMVMGIEQLPGVANLFSSKQVPGEILDLMVVGSDVLDKNPELGDALTGAWYETMALMNKRGAQSTAAMTEMAKLSGCTLQEFKGQLSTTAMFYTAKEAADYAESSEVQGRMESVRQFCFEHGLFGPSAKSADCVGIKYPDGTVKGDSGNATVHFDSSYMRKYERGELKTN